MNIEMNTIRLLGAAQLIVFVASMLSEQLLKSMVGSGNISAILLNISNNLTRMRISNLVALINCLAIIALGALFYIVLNEQNRTLALFDREYLPVMILGLPYAPYELVLGLWLVVKGFGKSAIVSKFVRTDEHKI